MRMDFTDIKNTIKVNNKLKIKVKGKRKRAKILQGTVVSKNDNIFIFKTEKYTESFQYADIYTGTITVL